MVLRPYLSATFLWAGTPEVLSGRGFAGAAGKDGP